MIEIWLVVVPLIVLLILWLALGFKWYIWDEHKDHNYISFDRFVAFYNINPERWDLYNDHVLYKVRKTHNNIHGFEYTLTEKYIGFHFNFIDRIKYKRWKSNRHKLKKQQEHFKEYQEVLECVKKDLEQFTHENDEMMKHEAEKYQKQVEDILFM